MLSSAAIYPASTRLLVAAILLVLFGLVAPRRPPRPLPLAVMSAIVAGWLFGATLIWGTGRGNRFPPSSGLSAVHGTPLLALAVLGALSASAALRAFAHQKRRLGWGLATVFAVAFAAWSSVVRYSVIVAALVFATGVAALAFASTSPAVPEAPSAEDTSKSSTPRGRTLTWIIVLTLPLLSGFSFYWWLRWSPKTWIDPACGLPDWLLLTFIPFVATPGLVGWIRTRTAGRSREAAAAVVVGATAVTIAACILAFLIWFGLNKCGE